MPHFPFWLLFLFSLIAPSSLLAQSEDGVIKEVKHVTWTQAIQKISDTKWELSLRATIDKGWHIYDKESGIEGVDSVSWLFNEGSVSTAKVERKLNTQKLNDPIFQTQASPVLTGKNEWTFSFEFPSSESVPAQLHVLINYQIANTTNFLPESFTFTLPLSGKVPSLSSLKIPTLQLDAPVVSFQASAASSSAGMESSYLELFFLGFLGGLIALLTPCVFPMIPLTISFFSKSTSTRKGAIQTALLYGGSIIVIYAALSIPFHVLDKLNPNILNEIATSPILNLIFFALFIIFALSFFGLFEITLPSSLGNMADARSRTQKHLGIFFMALTLCIVSFSCTGPILGSLLAGSLSNASGGAKALTAGLLGFGIALALPFALLAFFPHSLSRLPKSGGWMNIFKVSLGFFELAFALKFLSNADLIWHWNFLKREIFVLSWVILGVLYFLYLIGKLKIYEYAAKPSVPRVIWALLIMAFTVYMSLALPKKPISKLTLLSGFAPPEFYSIYSRDNQCALSLDCEKDYARALALSKQTGKPLLLDFTGWACVNCRKMEENIWADPSVYDLINERFILVSLYVDDRKALAAHEQIYGYTTEEGLKVNITTVGEKWSIFETENFKNNAQPLYAIVSPDERLLISPVGYLPDIPAYKNWLTQGLSALEKKP